ncbi:MAG: hypothetical protein HY925_09090 [Elusimicrobia bacterium]|nr:hypothetical protein [Elusimicrobiota bacterium]
MPVLLALLLAASNASAFTGGAGVNAAEFLSLRPGARALGMAEAYGPVAEGPDAMWWNPAGLTALERPEFSYTRTQYLRLMSYDFYAFAAPARWAGGDLGFSATIFQEDSLPVVDKTGTVLGSFRPHSEAFSFGWARELTRGGELSNRWDADRTWAMPGTVEARSVSDDPWSSGLSFGIAGKAIYQRYHTVRATAFAADLGFLWRPEFLRGLSFSSAARNLGSKIKFTNAEARLPAELSLGCAYDARHEEHHRFLPALEIHLPYYGRTSAGLGFEYSRHSRDTGTRLSWRVGYATTGSYDQSVLAGLTTGLGFQIARLSVDYGFAPVDALGDIYRMSLGWRF